MFGFDRWTDRSRRAYELAGAAARAYGSREILTSHLLLGFLQEGECVAAHVLTSLGITTTRVIDYLVRHSGPPVCADVPVTVSSEVMAAVGDAETEAARLGHRYIGTEHLLLGAVDGETAGEAAVLLTRLGISGHRVRHRTLELLSAWSVIPAENAGTTMPGGWAAERDAALAALDRAAHHRVASIYLAAESADAAADAELATEQAELAALRLVQAVLSSPADARPAGWPASLTAGTLEASTV